METKVATYSEKNERLQLLRVSEGKDLSKGFYFEIRANRIVIYRFPKEQALAARLSFYHCVHEILVNRSHAMLNLTS